MVIIFIYLSLPFSARLVKPPSGIELAGFSPARFWIPYPMDLRRLPLQNPAKIDMLIAVVRASHRQKGAVTTMSKKLKGVMLAIAILYLVLGLLLILWPEAARAVICYVLGAALVVYGVYRIVAYFVRTLPLQLQFGVAIGIASLLAGLLLLFKANFVVTVFGVVIGLLLIADGVFRLQNALDIRRMGGRYFLPLMLGALFVLVLGVVLLFNPFTAVITATIIGGVSLVIDGVLTLWSVVEASRLTAPASQPAARVH